jgi:uncharacterized protein (UPF0305 family)
MKEVKKHFKKIFKKIKKVLTNFKIYDIINISNETNKKI